MVLDAPVIRVDHVYKRYARNEARISLRHEIIGLIKRLTGMHTSEREGKPFFALQDINFEITAGEAVAIVGRNGSGKTTLLRILSGITRPTSGKVEVCGRFTSLIALGAGFIPDMTGRRNIYLNAAMYGIHPKEVDNLLSEIIEFSELQEFIDLPVKRYSSGMHARLGFSVAIHILPDVVFLDEVLAVGDQAFQEKCYRKILQFKEEGRTLVFVSHAPAVIAELCERTIWLDRGIQVMDGPTGNVLSAYANSLS